MPFSTKMLSTANCEYCFSASKISCASTFECFLFIAFVMAALTKNKRSRGRWMMRERKYALVFSEFTSAVKNLSHKPPLNRDVSPLDETRRSSTTDNNCSGSFQDNLLNGIL